MQIEKIEPRTITYRLSPDKEDKEYYSCMWVRYIFDCDNGRLNINSDAGDFSYGWGANVHEDFMHLMSRVGEEYLLNKLSSRAIFNVSKSKTETIKNIKKYGAEYLGINDQEQMDSVISRIRDIDENVGEEGFCQEISDILPGIEWEDMEIEKDYPYGAKVVVGMFVKYLQPKIREEFGKN